MQPTRLFVLTGLVTLAVAAVLVAATFAAASTDGAYVEPAEGCQKITRDDASVAGCPDPEPPRFCSNCLATVTPTATATTEPPPTATATATSAAEPSATSVATATSVPPSTASPASPGLAGDVNCDGVVDSKDALLILQFEAGSIDSLPCGENGDVNGDGVIDSLDALLVLGIEAASPA